MGGINWTESIVGFLLGLSPLAARQTYIFIKYFRLPGKRKYIGVWWEYHKSTTGSGSIYERELEIKYSLIFDRLTVRTQGDRLAYAGHISARQGMVRYVELQDEASHERVIWYLFDPFFDPVQKTAGLYIALDLNGLPAAGPMLLSKERIPISAVEGQLREDVIRINTSEIG